MNEFDLLDESELALVGGGGLFENAGAWAAHHQFLFWSVFVSNPGAAVAMAVVAS